MRIVGGALSGRRFAGPRGSLTRPTSERVREAIASSIESRRGFEGARVLDAFAGTGAYSFEALSRGAAHATLIEADARTARAIEDAAAALGVRERARVLRGDALAAGVMARAVAGGPFDLVFLDPPYAAQGASERVLDALLASDALAADALVIVEHAAKSAPALPSAFDIVAAPRYGDTAILFARRSGGPAV